jgi:glycosyltransferase involved in cell wall biosynthesis
MVTHTYPRFMGDTTAPFVESIADAVAARGHEVDVLLPYAPDLQSRPASRVRLRPFRYAPTDGLSQWGYGRAMDGRGKVRPGMYAATPLAARALRRSARALLATGDYDVVHVHWVVPSGVLLSRITRDAATVVSLHGSDVSLAERSGLVRSLVQRAFARVGAVTAPSSDLLARAVALGAPEAAARLVPYGVESASFAPDAAGDRAGLRRALGAEGGDVLVLGLGRLVEVKGFEHLVDAAARAEGVRVAIAGDGELRPELERQIRATGAPVKLVGALDRAAVAQALAAADVVAVPSVVDGNGRVDGLPNTLLEALASGRAVVASAVGGIPDAISHGANGLLVPAGDPAALADALSFLRAHPAERERLGKEARRSAVERYTWAATAEALEDAYAAAIERSRERALAPRHRLRRRTIPAVDGQTAAVP